MDSHIYKVFFLWLWILTATDADVLQCPSCTYVNTDADIPGAVRTAIDTILHAFTKPVCKTRLTGPTSGMLTETCAPPDGKVAMCSYYEGSIDVKIDIFVTSFNIPMKMYQQGCYYTLRANAPLEGCHDRKNINEDKSAMKRILEEASSLVDDVVSFDGQLCVCEEAYCQDTSGVPQFGVLLPLFILAQFVAMLLLL